MISGSGTIGVSLSHGGITVDDNSRIFRLFKIIGGSNPYTAVEVQLDEADGARLPTGVYDVDSDAKQLWEVNGNTAIKPNRVVIGQPNPAGVGFLFDVGGIAPTTRTPLAVCVVRTEGVVTDIKITWQNPDGTLDCETVSECPEGGCASVWYCTEDGPVEVAVGDNPPEGWESGPYVTETEALEACPPPDLPTPECAGDDYLDSPGGDLVTLAATFTSSGSCSGDATCTVGNLNLTGAVSNKWADDPGADCFWAGSAGGGSAFPGDTCGDRGYGMNVYHYADGTWGVRAYGPPGSSPEYGGPYAIFGADITVLSDRPGPVHLQFTFPSADAACGGPATVSVDIVEI